MGETRVDLLHLLEDLRDAYPGPLEETILGEIVANALDSGARAVTITAAPTAGTLTVVDDGRGMTRPELTRYHDLAASTKTPGRGIGFAGVGIKLGLLACAEVLTESRRGKSHVATVWRLATRHRAPWNRVAPPGLVAARGTAVRLTPSNALSPLLDAAFLEAVVRRHYGPFLDPAFDPILGRHYPAGVTFVVNHHVVARAHPAGTVPLAARVARQRRPAALGWLRRADDQLPEEERGVAVSTLGKVIKRGWDWLGLAPQHADRITGLVECPALAACLTLNKGDFVRSGPRGATYLAYRKAIQEAVAAQLREWGDTADASESRRPRLRPLERDLQNVLLDLAEQFPLLGSLVAQRAGGQRRLPFGGRGEPSGGVTAPTAAAGAAMPAGETAPAPPGPEAEAAAARDEAPPAAPPATQLPGPRGPRRPAHYALTVRFEHRPDDPSLGRIVESTVWVNDAHPAYVRAAETRAADYHVALTTAIALAPFAVEAAQATAFVTTFLARWGDTRDGGRRRRKHGRKRRRG